MLFNALVKTNIQKKKINIEVFASFIDIEKDKSDFDHQTEKDWKGHSLVDLNMWNCIQVSFIISDKVHGSKFEG